MNRQRLTLIALAAFALAGCMTAAESKEEKGKTPAKAGKVAASAAIAAKVDSPAPAFTLKDSTGKTHNLADYKGKYVVLEWINFGCPFVVRHYDSGLMSGTQKAVAGDDLVWLSINTGGAGKEGAYTGKALDDQIAKFKWAGTAYLLDNDGTVGRAYGAKTTPHMYVINPEGVLIYAGAIDDSPMGDKITVNYVEAALKAARAG
ncbi:MAG TPA: redoxin domain-containing protein, partial [bacterium]|nr:redoxin domain-containing protein [bacterium]